MLKELSLVYDASHRKVRTTFQKDEVGTPDGVCGRLPSGSDQECVLLQSKQKCDRDVGLLEFHSSRLSSYVVLQEALGANRFQ
jgi:hypothetical protein